jgi:hypothetical protein
MVDIRRLAPHDPMPAGDELLVVVLQRFDEDEPRRTVIDIIVSRGAAGVETTHATRPDGTSASFEEALRAARTVAEREGVRLVYAIDRTAGPREQEVLRHHGDHGFAGEKLDDDDMEEGERGSDMRDRR